MDIETAYKSLILLAMACTTPFIVGLKKPTEVGASIE
jgi:hypothetical protein